MRRPPWSTLPYTLFPYTTLFRSRQVDQLPVMIMREARVVLVAKFLELFRVIDFDPARSVNLHRLEHRLDLVLVTQAVLHHIELQHTDGAEDDVVAHDRSVNLSGALFGKQIGRAHV